ncbi:MULTISPECIES: ethanolamine ammonia-lyase reactivating factor EutA [unclassified Oceanobacter]|uniref:ethanolamine ammonia-lyase reactivating factor EutA n=2 Tax=Gammaproteobacteria TaxID=1236 RepID=UPI0027356106|nr:MULTISPECIES: ethanolamine ammonia-lyase reactivating factor EutA [unclassified Oceanobacter]MDP2610492.1 ethanolamine ammonia-lyase reactivating factor EutA [Oceanobacter sp. 1_MG-2023]MDP2613750.1 ethanolamine ammonia-lyase reactivating factor EutA [Oceanobacter sp. 2_MG-2023]
MTPTRPDAVRLLGLDFGSTTSSMMVAEVSLGKHSVNGRMTYTNPVLIYRSPACFTPFKNQQIDTDALLQQLSHWMQQAQLEQYPAHTGAALITGLAARSDNARVLSQLIGERIGDALIATADDPGLESWMAFMGSCQLLSRYHHNQPVLNLDIGGGTTNLALGLSGDVQCCGCYYIGARHFRFEPGSYRLTGLSPYGRELLRQLGVREIPAVFETHLCQRIVQWMVQSLEQIVLGNEATIDDGFRQLALLNPDGPQHHASPLVTFSGGVGELIYHFLDHGSWPATTAYGDLGIDLARAIVASPILSRSLSVRPDSAGRATVLGLTLHSSDISGTSLYISNAAQLPLTDLPLLSHLSLDASQETINQVIRLAQGCQRGAAIRVRCLSSETDLPLIKRFAQRLNHARDSTCLLTQTPLVLLLENNIGKTLGNYLSNWGQRPEPLLVIDEIPDRQAQFIHVGRPLKQVIPISFFGMSQEAS